MYRLQRSTDSSVLTTLFTFFSALFAVLLFSTARADTVTLITWNISGQTAASHDVISVGPEAWEVVKRAVPAPLKYKWLYTHWKRACRAAGAPDLTLHDLRHFLGQTLVDEGRSEASVQQTLRHTDPTMTRRYTKRRDQHENALAMDKILFPPTSGSESRRA